MMTSNLSYMMERIQGVSTNTFRLEPQNTTTSSANKQIIFKLPSNALLNTKSIIMLFNATTEGGGARLPPKIESLIDRYEVSAGGVQISQGFSLYNVLVHAKSALMGSHCDSVLGHPEMVRTKSYVDGAAEITGVNPETYSEANGATQFAVKFNEGFLGSVEPSIIDSSLLPDLTLTIFLAGNEVLSSVAGPKLSHPTDGGTITDDGAKDAKFTLNNIRMNVEVIGLASAVYDAVIAKRIADVGFIELPYKTYYSFIDSHTGATKFSVSAQSLDRIWVVQRTAGFDVQGGAVSIKGYKVHGGFTSTTSGGTVNSDLGKPEYDFGGVLKTNQEKYTTKFFNMTLNESGGPSKYQLQLNGSFLPQYQANVEEMYAMSMNSVDRYYSEFMTLDQYRNNYFVQCFRLCLPGSSTRILSGTDTRAINLACSYNTTGVTNNSNVVIFTEQTSTLRVGPNRSIEPVL